MAMRTATPYWLQFVFAFGLLLVFLGERIIPIDNVRVMLTGIGVTMVLLSTAARAWAWSGSKGARKQIERVMLLCQVGVVVALLLYAMTTSWAPSSLDGPHAQGALTVLWIVVMVSSLMPLLMIEITLGISLRNAFEVGSDAKDHEEAAVDYMRVREFAWSGLSIAFAFCFLLVTCNVARERNIQRDVSYFKTSMAGESTQNIVKASADPLEVHLFFPDPNEAKEYVKAYFDSLAAATGNVEVHVHDRLLEADVAAKYGVSKDGVTVLARGTRKPETIDIPADELKEPEKLRRGKTLRTFDSKVNKALMKLARDKRKAYVMTGHGELNDPNSLPPDLKGRVPERRTTLFKQRLGELNYEAKDLGLIDLVKDVPDDATIVIMLAPVIPLQDAEWAALDRYLDKGGRLMIAFDPFASPSMGVLEGKFGLKFNPAHLTDEEKHLPQGRGLADNRIAVTTQFTAHSSTTALSRLDKGLFLLDAGALEDIPVVGTAPKKTVTIRSMESAFLDFDNNFKFTKDSQEKKQRWTIGTAVEGPKLSDGKDGYRALVYADADLFADLVAQQGGQRFMFMTSGPLLDDSVRWLGGEEVFGGDIVSEEDTTIEHTKNEKAAWFFLTVIGVPIIVLVLGLMGTSVSRRRRRAAKSEVTP